jgi:hypothetical protein
MLAWDYQETEYQKQQQADPEWYLERLILYGLKGKKLNKRLLQNYLPKLHIPEDRRVFLELLVWNKKF